MYYVQAQPTVPASTAPHFRTAKEPNKALTWTTSTTYSRATRTNDNENTRERRCHHLVFGCISRVPPSLSFLFSQSLYCLLSRYSHTHMHTYMHTHACAPDPAPTSMEARQPGDRRGNEFPNEAPLARRARRILLSQPFFHSIRTKSHLDPDIKEKSAPPRKRAGKNKNKK